MLLKIFPFHYKYWDSQLIFETHTSILKGAINFTLLILKISKCKNQCPFILLFILRVLCLHTLLRYNKHDKGRALFIIMLQWKLREGTKAQIFNMLSFMECTSIEKAIALLQNYFIDNTIIRQRNPFHYTDLSFQNVMQRYFVWDWW